MKHMSREKSRYSSPTTKPFQIDETDEENSNPFEMEKNYNTALT